MDELLRPADARVGATSLRGAGVITVEVAVFLAYDVRHKSGGIRLILLMRDFDGEVSAKTFCLGAGLLLAQHGLFGLEGWRACSWGGHSCHRGGRGRLVLPSASFHLAPLKIDNENDNEHEHD